MNWFHEIFSKTCIMPPGSDYISSKRWGVFLFCIRHVEYVYRHFFNIIRSLRADVSQFGWLETLKRIEFQQKLISAIWWNLPTSFSTRDFQWLGLRDSLMIKEQVAGILSANKTPLRLQFFPKNFQFVLSWPSPVGKVTWLTIIF